MRLISSKNIYYHSGSRDSGEIHDHATIFPSSTFQHDQDQEARLELIQFSTKHSFYNVSSNNRYFSYSENGAPWLATTSIPEGNYSVKELASNLTTALNAVSTALTWTVSVNLNTMKYSFAYTGTPAGTLILSEIGSSFALLGLPSGATYTITSNPLVSEHIVSIGNPSSIFIHLDIANSIFTSDASVSNILAEIPVISGSFFGTIYWEKISDFRAEAVFPSGTSGNTLRFSIRNDNNEIVELHSDWHAAFRFSVYDTSPSHETQLLAALVSEM